MPEGCKDATARQNVLVRPKVTVSACSRNLLSKSPTSVSGYLRHEGNERKAI